MSRRLKYFFYLSWLDFSAPYRGSYLGIVWGLIEPILYITLTFFFFQYVMRGSMIRGTFYANYVLPPLLAWLVASAGVNSALSAAAQFRQFLQEDIDLRYAAFIKFLPIFTIHLLMLILLLIFFYFSGMAEKFSIVYLVYALISLIAILVGIFWTLMSIAPFVKDVKNIVGVALLVGFWISPIFWDANVFPPPVSYIVQFNPFYYPLSMYRAAFTGATDQILTVQTFLFWAGCVSLLYFGIRIYRRAQPQFGDVI